MRNVFLLLFSIVLFMACDNDDHFSHYISVGTVNNPNHDGFFNIELDNNILLKVTKTVAPDYKPPTGQRILAEYTVLNKNEEINKIYNIKLYDSYNILTKGIFNLTPESQDSIGYDPVGINRMWIGNNFLNIEFYYRGYNKTHFITLAKDEKTPKDHRVHLEFRHNANKDYEHYFKYSIASFNLTSLQSLTNGQLLELVIYNYDGENQTHELTYKFGELTNESPDYADFQFEEIKDVEVE